MSPVASSIHARVDFTVDTAQSAGSEGRDEPRGHVRTSFAMAGVVGPQLPGRLRRGEHPPTVYAVTKAALTMLALQSARALPGMRINADPGYTATTRWVRPVADRQ